MVDQQTPFANTLNIGRHPPTSETDDERHVFVSFRGPINSQIDSLDAVGDYEQTTENYEQIHSLRKRPNEANEVAFVQSMTQR